MLRPYGYLWLTNLKTAVGGECNSSYSNFILVKIEKCLWAKHDRNKFLLLTPRFLAVMLRPYKKIKKCLKTHN